MKLVINMLTYTGIICPLLLDYVDYLTSLTPLLLTHYSERYDVMQHSFVNEILYLK